MRPSYLKQQASPTSPFNWRMSLLLGALLLSLNSCEKIRLGDLFKSTGKEVSIERNVDQPFTHIILENSINLVLTQGPEYRVILKGGENLLPGIDSNISDSTITFRNNNKFNWTRSYEREITAYITAPHFLVIDYESTGTISNNDTIHEDSLYVTSRGGSGYINLCINTRLSHFSINYGSVDMNISGICDNSFIYSGSYGPFHCLNLKTANTYIHNKGTNDCYINVSQHLEYLINGLGNIYYTGTPADITGSSNDQGQLIHLN